jgi:HEAT repeat protein
MIVLTDATLPPESRVAVLRRLAAVLSRRPEYIETLLRIVRDRDDDPAVRDEALRVLGSAAFQVARFTPHRQDYEDALHDLIDDPVPALREQSVTVLAQEHDPVVQETLLAGLRGERELPVEREEAIFLLAEDDHLDNLPWLRELYRSGSPEVREQAVRFMGSYPQARTTLEEILRDKSEPSGVRQQSAASLRSLDPDRFEQVAKQVVTDATDYPEIRVASLTALQHLGDPDRVRADSAFTDRVRELRADASSPEVAEVARDFLEQDPGT